MLPTRKKVSKRRITLFDNSDTMEEEAIEQE